MQILETKSSGEIKLLIDIGELEIIYQDLKENSGIRGQIKQILDISSRTL